MKDFNGNDLKVGDVIFFTHGSKRSIIGRISTIEGKKTIIVNNDDIIKSGPKFVRAGYGIVVNSDDVLKINL